MFSESAEFYDLIYSTFKDYKQEVSKIAALLRQANPSCTTILDVACGTGEHSRLLAEDGFAVDGLDLDPEFLQIARRKHPAGNFFKADMSNFHLQQRYNAVLCLFSSIGYVRTLARVELALKCFREHLTVGGVILLEPWFPPGKLDPNRVSSNSGESGGLRVTRVSRVVIAGRLSKLYFDYEIEDGSGVRHATEVHELGLFTHEELLDAFRNAGLDVEYDPVGLMDRGLYVARGQFRDGA